MKIHFLKILMNIIKKNGHQLILLNLFLIIMILFLLEQTMFVKDFIVI